jgi:hypothetical protein
VIAHFGLSRRSLFTRSRKARCPGPVMDNFELGLWWSLCPRHFREKSATLGLHYSFHSASARKLQDTHSVLDCPVLLADEAIVLYSTLQRHRLTGTQRVSLKHLHLGVKICAIHPVPDDSNQVNNLPTLPHHNATPLSLTYNTVRRRPLCTHSRTI